MKRENVRNVAIDILLKIEKQQAYSNLLLNETIKKTNLSEKDVPLLTELVYGTIQYKKRLDFYISKFSKKPLSKLDDWVLILLRITLYQMIFLDRIPYRAAVYEGVQIAKKRGHRGIANMVNGILRSIQRKGLPDFSIIDDEIQRIAVKTSHPTWLIERWIEQYGKEQTLMMAEANLTHPIHTARVNVLKTTVEHVIDALSKEGVKAERSEQIEESIVISSGAVAKTEAFKNGLITIQDEGSMLVAYALNPKEDERILDACAAPGGKSTHIAEKMNDRGKVISLDIHDHKVNLIKEQQNRLNISSIEAVTMDARDALYHFEKESFDRILVDAPCSGLGVIQRKPDIKWTKSIEDIYRLAKVQREILEAVWPLLKVNGLLVYSTCTVDKEENEQLITKFVEDHHDAAFDRTLKKRVPEAFQALASDFGWLQLFPGMIGTDGFFIAAVKKDAKK